MTTTTTTAVEACGICGDTAGRCRFERGCSCWRGQPCTLGGRLAARRSPAPGPIRRPAKDLTNWSER